MAIRDDYSAFEDFGGLDYFTPEDSYQPDGSYYTYGAIPSAVPEEEPVYVPREESVPLYDYEAELRAAQEAEAARMAEAQRLRDIQMQQQAQEEMEAQRQRLFQQYAAQQEELIRVAREREAARIAAEQEAARVAAEQEAARRAAEQEAIFRAEQQRAAQVAAEQEAARRAAEEAARVVTPAPAPVAPLSDERVFIPREEPVVISPPPAPVAPLSDERVFVPREETVAIAPSPPPVAPLSDERVFVPREETVSITPPPAAEPGPVQEFVGTPYMPQFDVTPVAQPLSQVEERTYVPRETSEVVAPVTPIAGAAPSMADQPPPYTEEQGAAGARAMALASLVNPNAFGNMYVGDAAFGGGPPIDYSRYARNVASDVVGGQGSLYEEGALEAAKEAAKDPYSGFWGEGLKQVVEQDPSLQPMVDAKIERELKNISKVEKDYDVMKPLSDLLKANKFQEAFAYAKENGVTDRLLKADWLSQLRQPFTAEEMQQFYNAIPPDYAGTDFNYDPQNAAKRAITSMGATPQWAGYPDPQAVFVRKEDKTVENLAKVAGAAMLAAGFAPGLAGAGGAGGAGGAAGAGAGAGAGGVGGALKSAYQFVTSIPQTIGGTVANALGLPISSSVAQAAFGNSLISGVTTAARGGDIGDIIRSGLIAAGVTYGLDSAVNAIKGMIPDVSKTIGTQVSNAASAAGVDPATALNALQEIVVTGKKVSDVAGLAGAVSGAVTQPSKSPLDKATPDDLKEITVTGTRPVLTLPILTVPEPSPLEVKPEDIAKGYEPTKVEPPLDNLEEITVTGTRPSTTPLVVKEPSQGGLEKPFVPAPTVGGMQEIAVEGEAPKVEVPPIPTPFISVPEPPPIDIKTEDILKDYKPTEVKESGLDQLKSAISKYQDLQKLLKLIGALGAGASGGKTVTPTTGGPPSAFGGALPKYELKRTQYTPAIDYYNYGLGPEAKFFDYEMKQVDEQAPEYYAPNVSIVPPKDRPPVFQSGGLTGYAQGGDSSPQYVDGPGSGRDDKIPALLSDGEYVIDAETLALLGDGSTKEGARRMDEFRAKIRKHKGRALSRGRISPDAKSPDKYMGGGLT
jgi:hypothetical protein